MALSFHTHDDRKLSKDASFVNNLQNFQAERIPNGLVRDRIRCFRDIASQQAPKIDAEASERERLNTSLG